MPQWVVVAHLVVEAETSEQATALAEAAFAPQDPAGSRGPHDDARAPRCTVSSVRQLPERPIPRLLPRDETPPSQ